MEQWTLKPFPTLNGINLVALDTEGTGLDYFGKDYFIGLAMSCAKGSFYFPVRHENPGISGNVPMSNLKRWAKGELYGKRIVFHHAKFDLHFLEKEGIELRDINVLEDTMHMAALLEERTRGGLNLSNLAKIYLGLSKTGEDLEITRMAWHTPEEVGPYAENDTELTYKLREKMYEALQDADMIQALELESRNLPAVVEMERNGLLLDMPKLNMWRQQVTRELISALDELAIKAKNSSQAMLALDDFTMAPNTFNPDKTKHLEDLCRKLDVPYLYNIKCLNDKCGFTHPGQPDDDCPKCGTETKTTTPHFASPWLLQTKNETLKKVVRARKLSKLKQSLDPWGENVDSKGILRYNMNQLKGDEWGTISGRYSCSGYNPYKKGSVGLHPQQIWKPEKQIEEIGDNFIMRELFIAEKGKRFLSSDAEQIEYRLLVDYIAMFWPNSVVVKMYKDDPHADLHAFVAHRVLKDLLTRSKTKTVNFGYVYGLGLENLAKQLGVSMDEADQIRNEYIRLLPEVPNIVKKMKDMARKRIDGSVRTRNKRKLIVPNGKEYMAANRIIQGTAAEVMKDRAAALYENRKDLEFVMRVLVHDEVNGDTPDEEHARRVHECLEDFGLFNTTIPLLWDTNVGDNWAMRETA